MTPVQKEMFMAIDVFWEKYGFGPSIDDLMRLTHNKSRSNVSRICNLLVREKLCKRTPKMARSIRPHWINLKGLE